MALLPDDRILALHAAAISVGLDRTALLAGIPPGFVQSIATGRSNSSQILIDLHTANLAERLLDGREPLILWLQNALPLAGGRSERSVFENALAAACAASPRGTVNPPPIPSYRDTQTRLLAEELKREQARLRALDAAGAPSEVVKQRILEIRRKLREGGQLREGDTLGRRTLLQIIGRGGFAVVWKAFDTERKAIVAIKVLHTNLAGDEVRRDRFFRGARTMAELDHPAIVKVLMPAGEDEGFHFFVMEHIDGEDLQRAVVNGRFLRARALPIILKVGEALGLAHANGFVHRDVKPANILLSSSGEPKLTDFDLVGAGDTTGGTRTGALGTFLFAAPESLEKPQEADARVDVFGLAMTAAFALHGRALRPADWRQPDAFVDALKCGPGVKGVLKLALDWDRDRRFTDAQAFCSALRGAIVPVRLSSVEAIDKTRVDATLSLRGSELSESHPPAGRKGPMRVAVQPWLEQGEDAFGRCATFAVNGIVQRMRWIPPGTFWMGSPESEAGRNANESPRHEVVLTNGYWLGETPCTQALWEAVMGINHSCFKGQNRPVENVSWYDCQTFLRRLAVLVPRLDPRLPSEAEWELACRAGTLTATWVGDLEMPDVNYPYKLDAIAWYDGNSGVGFDLKNGLGPGVLSLTGRAQTPAGTHPVAMKEANPFGLHDMLGNVYEWCEDGERHYANERVTDPQGPKADSLRAIRGGSWGSLARECRAAARAFMGPLSWDISMGFRLATSQTPRKRD